MLLQDDPILICWNLLKNMCTWKYGGKKQNISVVKYTIFKDNYIMLSVEFHRIKWLAKWNELIQKCERSIQDTKVSFVAWSKPLDQWIKVNTNSSALTNLGRLGAGGILRNKDGQLLMAFATNLGEGTKNKA